MSNNDGSALIFTDEGGKHGDLLFQVRSQSGYGSSTKVYRSIMLHLLIFTTIHFSMNEGREPA
jgi:hypothetical protein